MRQRVFTGVVTQLQDNHGIVDQEVRFSMSVVVGRVPLVGEKVLVKAVQDPLQSLGWTAQRVQAVNGQPFKSPPPLLPSMPTNMKPGILGNKPQPLLKSPKIPPLIPSMQPNPGMHQMPHHQQMPWTAPYDGWGVAGRKRHGDAPGGRRGGRCAKLHERAQPSGIRIVRNSFHAVPGVREEGGGVGGGGGSWAGDSGHQKRRRWRVTPEEEVPKKSSATSGPSSPLFSCFPRDSQAYDCLELSRRYPHLRPPSALFHVQLCWPESFPPSLPLPLPLASPCCFHVGPEQTRPETESTPASTDSTFSVKVMLLSMPGIKDFYAQSCPCSDDGQALGDAVHPTTLIKFLLLERAGELQLAGGFWCPERDGSNPLKDGSALIRTAVRCVKEQTGLDLTSCTQWHKMAELRLLSGDKMETLVLLLPDVWNLVLTEEEWAKLKDEGKDDACALPDLPSLLVRPAAGFALSAVSLASLLDPRASHSRDAFEVCFSCELFSEMLQRDFGLQLYHSLCRLAQGSSPAQTPKSKTDDNGALTDDEPKNAENQTNKKAAADGRKKSAKDEEREQERAEVKEETELPEKREESKSQAPSEEETTSSASDSHAAAKDSDGPLAACAELSRRVLLSWLFFDRQLTGHLREQDVQNILLSLGLYLSSAQAQELVRKASAGGQCLYRKLCSRWMEPEEEPCDLSAEGNKALLPAAAAAAPGKERASARRSGANASTDVISYKGTVLNVENLLRTLNSCKTTQSHLEERLAELQTRLEAAEAKRVPDEADRVERAEAVNKAYEKSLKENAGHMLAIIEQMQKMVDQTTILTRTVDVKEKI